jgi:hypothetical protein
VNLTFPIASSSDAGKEIEDGQYRFQRRIRPPISPSCAIQQSKRRGEGRGDKGRQETYSDAESAEEWRDGRSSTCAGGSVEVDEGIVSFQRTKRDEAVEGKEVGRGVIEEERRHAPSFPRCPTPRTESSHSIRRIPHHQRRREAGRGEEGGSVSGCSRNDDKVRELQRLREQL